MAKPPNGHNVHFSRFHSSKYLVTRLELGIDHDLDHHIEIDIDLDVYLELDVDHDIDPPSSI
jgi:hypothetical protein